MRLSNDRCRELTEALRDAGRLPLRPGVLNTEGWRVSGGPSGVYDAIEGVDYDVGMSLVYVRSMWEAVPLDLNDAATIGVLAGYARELYGDGSLYVYPYLCGYPVGIRWRVDCVASLPIANGPSRVEAWVDAILRAPGRGGE